MAKILNSVIIIVYFLSLNGAFNQGCVRKDDSIKKVDADSIVINMPNPVVDTTTMLVTTIPATIVEIEEVEEVKEDPKIVLRNNLQSTYMSHVGVREKTGHNDGREVEMYLKSAGLSKGNPWCASFVAYVYKENKVNTPKSGLGWVPSYFPPKKTIYVRGKYNKMKPKYGDLIGIWFPEKGRLAHIGFYDNEDNKYYYSVEGNTNKAGSREGDGVYIKKRIKGQIHSISNWID